MIELNSAEIRALRAQAHHLKPVVSISQNGLSDNVLGELDRSLKAHALIKVKFHGIRRADREAAQHEICRALDCAPVQHIGNILVLWRPKPEVPAKPTRRRNPRPLTKKQAAIAAERHAKR